MCQRLKSTDYAYDGMQFGTGANYLPTLQHAPNHTVHVIGVSYVARFRRYQEIAMVENLGPQLRAFFSAVLP